MTEENIAVKKSIMRNIFFITFLLWANIFLPGSVRARPGVRPPTHSESTTQVNGAFIIIVNDLVKVTDEGNLVIHEVKGDAKLNIQAKVAGRIRIGSKGYWNFKRGQTIRFLKSVMYLTSEITVPVTIEVLGNLLDEHEESNSLPLLIKGKNDKKGMRYDLRVDAAMMAGKLFRAGE